MPYIPETLKQQLKPGGRLVAPVGAGETQRLMLVEALPEGGFSEKELEAVKFVPLLSGVT
jgi:protein-L-isoaspartate(D-aspartate) O-methyltransferase